MKRPAALLALLLASGVALAEPPGERGGPPPIQRLTQDLGLDENQQAAVQRIFDEQHAKMEAERSQFESSGSRPSREEMRARHEQMNTELRAQLATVLTAEQLARFDSMRKRQGPKGPPPEGATQSQ